MFFDFVCTSRNPTALQQRKETTNVDHCSKLGRFDYNVHSRFLRFTGVLVKLRQFVDELLELKSGDVRLERGHQSIPDCVVSLTCGTFDFTNLRVATVSVQQFKAERAVLLFR